MSFSKTVDVPDLKGKTVIEANELLSKSGLFLKVEGEDYDPIIPSGRILRQDIPSGNKVKEERGIKVFLSKGPKVQFVPDLIGQTLQEAETTLARSGLKVEKVIRIHSDTVARDRILSQRPEPDEALKDSLSLVVSSGPYDILYFCPDFLGKSRDDALSLSEKLGLKVEFTGQGQRIKAQKPRQNTLFRSGETVILQLEGE
jgi:serine/threonine-protein kinase